MHASGQSVLAFFSVFGASRFSIRNTIFAIFFRKFYFFHGIRLGPRNSQTLAAANSSDQLLSLLSHECSQRMLITSSDAHFCLTEERNERILFIGKYNFYRLMPNVSAKCKQLVHNVIDHKTNY